MSVVTVTFVSMQRTRPPAPTLGTRPPGPTLRSRPPGPTLRSRPALSLLCVLVALRMAGPEGAEASLQGVQASGQSRVNLEENGYTGVLVAIDPSTTVPADQQQGVVDYLTNLLTEASSFLYGATGYRAYFKEARILVPSDWAVGGTVDGSPGDTYGSALLRIVDGGLYGSAPYTHQSGPCGTPGIAVSWPLDLVQGGLDYGSHDRLLAHSWLRLRYGVFEEHGYPDDLLYPHAFADLLSNSTLPTTCAGSGLAFTWVDSGGAACHPSPEDASCRMLADSAATTSTTSILFSTTLESVKEVCSADSHAPDPPTPHNRLCGGASVLEVVLRHPDFAEGNNLPGSDTQNTVPTVTVVRSRALPLFLLLDNTINLDPPNSGLAVYSILRNTLRSILEDAAVPSFGAVKFDSSNELTFYQNGSLIPIAQVDLEDVVAFVPLELRLEEYKTSAGMALGTVVELLKNEPEVNLMIVQISNTVDSAPDLTNYSNFHLSGSLRESSTPFNTWLQGIVESSGGMLLYTSSTRPSPPSTILLQLTTHSSTHFLLDAAVQADVAAPVTQAVLLDSSLGTELFTTAAVTSSLTSSLTPLLTMTVTSPSGAVYSEVEHEASPTVSLVIHEAEPGEWSLFLNTSVSVGSATISATARSNITAPHIQFSTWTNLDHVPGAVAVQERPLAVFVSALQGGKTPVTGLSVTGYVRDNKAGASISVTLGDTGTGDPDTQANDGIYSAYVAQFGSLSNTLLLDYSVEAAQDGSMRGEPHPVGVSYRTAPRLLPSNPFSPKPCCGSSVPLEYSVQAQFLRLTLYSAGAVSVSIPEQYDPPPSRVTDFILTGVDQNGPSEGSVAGTVLVSMRWTAPGADLTQGTVSSYSLRYSDNRTALTLDFASATAVTEGDLTEGSLTPAPPGSTQAITAKLPKELMKSTAYYMGLTASDGTGQESGLSPILMTLVDAGEEVTTTTTTAPTTTTTAPTTTTTAPTTTTTAPTTTTTAPTATNTASTATGTTATGTTGTGTTVTGTTVAGSTATGSTATGSTATGSTATGSTATGSTATGSTATGSTATGSTATSSTATGSTATGSTATGSTATGSTATGSTATSSTATGSTATGSTATDSTVTGSTVTQTTEAGFTSSTEAPSLPGDSNFVGSVGFWIVIGLAIVIVVGVAFLCWCRLTDKSSSITTPHGESNSACTTDASLKSGKLTLPSLSEESSRRPSRRANVMSRIEEVRTSHDEDSRSHSSIEDLLAAAAVKADPAMKKTEDLQQSLGSEGARKTSTEQSMATREDSYATPSQANTDQFQIVEVTEL